MLINVTAQGGAEQRSVLWCFFIILVERICASALDFCLNSCILQKEASCFF